MYIQTSNVQKNQKNMKLKQTNPAKSSNLPLKMLFFSYFNSQQSIQLMSDCHNAINDKITKLASMIDQNFQQISSIFQDDQQNSQKQKSKQGIKMMEVIQEEDYWATERSNQQRESLTDRNRNLLVKKFNNMIGLVEKSSNKFQEIMFMYKNEIKQIAKDLTKEKQINAKLIKESQQKGTKDVKQIRSNSLSEVLSKKPYVLGSKQGNLQKKNIKNKTISQLSRPVQDSQDEQARQPPKPFCQECLLREKQAIQKQKQQAQQKNKWRDLSNKITNMKNQLSRYEQQLISKQGEISQLNEQLRKKNEDHQKLQNEQKRKIKTINTTLRGEKIVLQNQLQSLKKKLDQNSEYICSIESENRKLQLQKDNLESTIKWHINTIEDLRNNFSQGIKQQGQILNKYNQLKETNLFLQQQVSSQEKYLEQFASNLKTVEENFNQQIQTLTNKIHDLQQIIEQKNHTIIKLKLNQHDSTESTVPKQSLPTNKQLTYNKDNRTRTKQSMALKRDSNISGTIMNKTMKKEALGICSGHNKNQNFEQNMVKILNKKLAIKECQIQKLKQDNQFLRAELQVYKELE